MRYSFLFSFVSLEYSLDKWTGFCRLVANALNAWFSRGDTIAIDMPMTVSAVIIYLAIVLAGMVVVSIADSFAAKEIATRLHISKAKGIFTQVCGCFAYLLLFHHPELLKHISQDVFAVLGFYSERWSEVPTVQVILAVPL